MIGVDVSGLRAVVDALQRYPREAMDAGADAASAYLLNVLRTYPPYRYVSVAQAGGWRSERQRRYVMAAIRDGRITVPYRRTQRLRRGWQVVGSGTDTIIVNETPYAGYVMGDMEQTLGHMLRGWDILSTILRDREAQIERRYDAAARKVARRMGL